MGLKCIGQVRRVEVCYQLNGFAVAGQLVNDTVEELFTES